MQITDIHDAKTHFLQLVDTAAGGEEIIITKTGKPAARLVPMCQAKVKRIFGSLKGKVCITKHFDAPLSEDEMALFEGH